MSNEYWDSFYLLQFIYLFVYFGTFDNFQRIESHYYKMKKNQDTSETKEDCLVLRLHNVMS
jgi:hypothetical protein